MTIRFEKKAYEAPKMTVVELIGTSELLSGSTEPGSDITDDDFDGGFSSVGIFGNDKA